MQPFDALTMRAVLQEAKPLLIGRKVDKVYQLGRDEVVFSLRGKSGMSNLLLSAQSAYGRLCLIRQGSANNFEKQKSNQNQSQFLLVLRHQLTGATLVGIEQPAGERTVDLVFSCVDEVGGASRKVFTAEIMGRHSNLIFWDKSSEKILSASHVVTSEMSRQREVAANLRFVRPPKQDKPNVFTLDEETFEGKLRELLNSKDGSEVNYATVEQWLINTFTGMGRQLAEEFVAAANVTSQIAESKNDPELGAKLWSKIIQLQNTEQFKPAYRQDLSRYSVLSWWPGVENSAQWKHLPTANDMVDDYYRIVETREQFQQLRERLRSELKNETEKLENRISVASQHIIAGESLEHFKHSGDLILANMHAIQVGQETLTCENLFGESGGTQTIKLNPNLNASQNAQSFYRQYAKTRSRLTAASAACDEAKQRLSTLRLQTEAIESASDTDELRRLKDNLIGRKASELPKATQQKPGDKKKQKTKILSLNSSDGWTIYVGRNRHENDQLLGRMAQPNDLWLHILGQGGAHVLIKVPASKQEPPLTTIKEAAQVAARLSKASTGTKVRVVYTQCKHVKKLGKDKPGLVRYENEKTLEVDTATPMPKCMKQLFSN
ncbi:MAG TPA: NFACT RNA binding domain-containing protein [Drouetiella sp.]